MKDKLSVEELIDEIKLWYSHYISSPNCSGSLESRPETKQAYEQIKSRLTPVPKHKIRELVENKAHKFLMDNFVNEIPPIEKMPLDETARWIQYIEKLIYSSLEAFDNLREGKEG